MSDVGWQFLGMKFDWFIILFFLLMVALVIYFSVRRGHPTKRADRRAGDEGEDDEPQARL